MSWWRTLQCDYDWQSKKVEENNWQQSCQILRIKFLHIQNGFTLEPFLCTNTIKLNDSCLSTALSVATSTNFCRQRLLFPVSLFSFPPKSSSYPTIVLYLQIRPVSSCTHSHIYMFFCKHIYIYICLKIYALNMRIKRRISSHTPAKISKISFLFFFWKYRTTCMLR